MLETMARGYGHFLAGPIPANIPNPSSRGTACLSCGGSQHQRTNIERRYPVLLYDMTRIKDATVAIQKLIDETPKSLFDYGDTPHSMPYPMAEVNAKRETIEDREAIRLNGGIYAVELKLDDSSKSEDAISKGQTIRAKIADAVLSAGPRSVEPLPASTSEASAVESVRLGDIVSTPNSMPYHEANVNQQTRDDSRARSDAQLRVCRGKFRMW